MLLAGFVFHLPALIRSYRLDFKQIALVGSSLLMLAAAVAISLRKGRRQIEAATIPDHPEK